MIYLTMMGAALAALSAGPTLVHTVSVDHSTGPAVVQYSGEVDVRHRQIGTPGPAGRESTLRCVWTAGLTVERVAKAATGSTASRSFAHDKIATGSRPGWCKGNVSAMARDAADSVGDTSRHIAAAAEADRPVLNAELEGLTARPVAG